MNYLHEGIPCFSQRKILLQFLSPNKGEFNGSFKGETISPHSGVVVSPLAIGGHNVRVMLENIKCSLFILNQNTSFVSQFFRPAALKLSQQHVCKQIYLICHCEVDPEVVKMPNCHRQGVIVRVFEVEIDNCISSTLV